MYTKGYGVIIHPCPKYNSHLANKAFKLGQGLVIISCIKIDFDYLSML